jgi:RNA polymerase sigma-70 factor, ECF subfamily
MNSDWRAASDSALVVGVARYEEAALAELYRRHAGPVFALARKILISPAAAEEVVQEVFLRVWNAPDRFNAERGSLRSFLLAQAHGRAVDAARSDGARRRREEREARMTAEAGYDLEREIWDMTLNEHVRDALAELPSDERQAIELAYFGGYTYREVATLLEQPEGTTKGRIRTGLQRLHATLVRSGAVGDSEAER